jgi:hypothetical protein
MAEIAIKEVKGGQITRSTDGTAWRPGSSSATNVRAASTCLFIFQFPATNGLRMITSQKIDFQALPEFYGKAILF